MAGKPKVVSPENKALAKYVVKAFGGTPHVTEYEHDTADLSIGILWCQDRPVDGVTSYSTIRLSDYPMTWGKGEFPTRIELASACASKYNLFPNILASAAFCIIRTQRPCYPGAVMPDYVREYYASTAVPHLYFTAPFLWEDALRPLNLQTKTVNWLLAMGISESEYSYLKEHGDNSLEDRFEERQIDIFDLSRPSAV
jgi:antitoxin YqcF